MSVSDRKYPLLFREGEMATRIKNFPWETSPLGPMHTWPTSLHASVDMALATKFPCGLYWGQDHIVFYNDAYSSILGARHPQALGQPCANIWEELWDPVVAPLFESVKQTGVSSWNEDQLLIMTRNGYPEETYYTFSYSLVRDDTCAPAGIFNPAYENTNGVISKRRFGTIRELMRLTAHVESMQAACDAAIKACATNRQDIPFALLYLFEDQQDGDRVLKLKAHTNIDDSNDAAPGTIVPDEAAEVDEGWPVAKAIKDRRLFLVSDIVNRFGILSGGAWPEHPEEAVVMPIAVSEQAEVCGVLVMGVNSRLRFNNTFGDFVEIFTTTTAAAINTVISVEQERQRAMALAELDRAKTNFFSNVSHELRTPLTLIMGPLSEVTSPEASYTLPDTLKRSLTMASRNAERLLKLVNTLLDYSRIEANKMKANFQPTDLGHFTSCLVAMFESTFEKAGLLVDINLPAPTAPIYAYVDRTMWEKIVFNLLSNAFKFTLKGSIHVRLEVDQSSQQIVFAVSDTGVGIPPAELPHVFERFHRVAGSAGRSYEGTGIGLALTLELVRMHGGGITVASEVGTGTTFTVSISTPSSTSHIAPDQLVGLKRLGPIEEAANMSTDPNAEQMEEFEKQGFSSSPAIIRPSAMANMFLQEANRWLPDEHAKEYLFDNSSTDGSLDDKDDFVSDDSTPSVDRMLSVSPASGMVVPHSHRTHISRIILADDNPDMRQYVGAVLRQRPDWHVHVVADGKAALDYALAHPPNLVISDVLMPVMDGFELIRNLKSHASTAMVPVILLSGRAGEEGKVEGLSAGADDYLVKPFGVKELLARAQTHLELGRLRTDLERKVRHRTEELTKVNEELHMSETRYRILSTFSPVGILLTDDKGAMQYVNDQYLKIAGLTTWQAGGHGWRNTLVPEDQQRLTRWFEQHTEQQTESHFKQEMQFIVTGNVVWGLVQSEPIMGQAHIKGHVFVVTDITERKQLERERVEAIQRAEAAQRKRAQDAEMHQRQQEQFVDMICHEIRNPLNGILNNADLLSTSVRSRRSSIGELDPTLLWRQVADDEEAIEAITLCAKHQQVITNDVLQLSKLESGLVVLEKVAFKPAVTVRTVMRMFEAEARAKEIEISVHFSSDFHADKEGVTLEGDPHRISQVLINLLSNAFKFTTCCPVRRIDVSLNLILDPPDTFLRVSVRDTGLGMTIEQQGRLFQRFSQVKTNTRQQYEGSGLGLFLSKSFINMMGGDISVESNPGTGSKFSFTIKTKVLEAASSTAPSPPSTPKSPQVIASTTNVMPTIAAPTAKTTRPKTGHSILIVEDNTVNQRVLQRHLTAAGYVCTIVSNGLQAVNLFEKAYLSPPSSSSSEPTKDDVDNNTATTNTNSNNTKPPKESVDGTVTPPTRRCHPSSPFDLVFMDIEMPVMGGLEATQRIRDIERTHGLGQGECVPIVGLSGNAREVHINEGLASGMQQFLTKPYQKENLLETIEQLLLN